MKQHHLSVTTLEEYEPNREFVGRNFNGGEIIQLVLKARSGHWLPFSYVQMVMMHELAHCVQMNHSRAFWKVRNLYADQMRALWGRGYTGDGMWGRGALLATGAFEADAAAGGEELPEHLCGGAYRSRRRSGAKRRRGKGTAQDLSHQERRKLRRIERRFGKNGVALGADDEVKARLEKGRRTQATPRVAGSSRGRDLRAAAALARLEQQKQEVQREDESAGGESGASDEESDYDDADDADLGADDAVDMDGKKLLDAEGNRMVKVCEDENPEGEEAANELKELRSSITKYFAPSKDKDGKSSTRLRTEAEAGPAPPGPGPSRSLSLNDSNSAVEGRRTTDKDRQLGSMRKDEAQPYSSGRKAPSNDAASSKTASTSNKMPRPKPGGTACAVCSFENEPYAVTCSMCSHVLNAAGVPGTWKCQSASCKDSGYLNAGDCGACGVCGQRKGAGA